ncbi:SLC13 family permease [Aliivibrio logei]|uniref:SLC13 family permease n=1 Tax=Aliivibrio logei TaxID=688 RepID=UPI0035C91E22
MLLTAFVLIGLIICLVSNHFAPSKVFLSATAVLYIGGEITQDVLLNNSINRSIVTLLLLLLSAIALERTYLLTWASKKLFHQSYKVTLFRLAVISSISSAFLNNTAVVATLIGTVLKNQFHSSKKLLIPLSYFSILGGTLTLIGTATNLVVSGLLEEQGLSSLSIFSFFPVGGLLLLFCGITIIVMTRFLPQEEKQQQEASGYFIDAEVSKNSKLINKTVVDNGLRALDGLFLCEIIRDKQLISPVSPNEVIQRGDKLLFSGDISEVKQLSSFDGLTLYVEDEFELNKNLVEVLVSPESILINRTLKSAQFRSRFDAAVVAISRQGKQISGKLGELTIQSGDKLILAVGDDFKKRPNLSRNFFLLDDKQVKEPLSLLQNIIGIGGFFSAVLIASTTPLNLIDTLLCFLGISLVFKVTDATQLRRRFPFDLLVILVSALSIASAFSNSGLAFWLTEQFQYYVQGVSVNWILVGLIILSIILTEIMTNTAAAAIMLPIALALATSFSVNYLPFVMAITYGASASFISPFGYQTNLMVMNAGNYNVKDFMKIGWPVTAMYIVVASVAIPCFFPF